MVGYKKSRAGGTRLVDFKVGSCTGCLIRKDVGITGILFADAWQTKHETIEV